MRISDWSSDVCSSDLANPPPFAKGVGADATPIQASPDPDAHVIADVFRIVNDPFVGKLGVFRVYQGTVKKDSQLFVDDGKKPFKVAPLFSIQGKAHVDVTPAIPGSIAAVGQGGALQLHSRPTR